MRWPYLTASGILSRPIDKDAARLWRALRDHPEHVVVGLGLFLRIIVYLYNRAFWMDEASLWGNLANKRVFDLSEPLSGDQLAPFGFLIAQRALMAVLGSSNYASRLIPLVCGVLALLLFWRLVGRVLPRRPALIALVLFALSDDLIYYASELKPYSVDLAVGLAITLVALDALMGPISLRRAMVLALAAVGAPWVSFASAFVVAGCGIVLIATALQSARYRLCLVWALIGIAWLASLLVCYTLSKRLLSPYTTMYIFWNFAVLPINVSRPSELFKAAGILLEIFVNPLNLLAPAFPAAAVILPAALMVAGTASLASRARTVWAILILPIVLAIAASAMKRYPLHGRLILELVPAFFLFVAEGTEWLRTWDKSRIKPFYTAIVVLLLAHPCLATLEQVTFARLREFNSHGDLHKNRFMT
jgi:hypothetical protein